MAKMMNGSQFSFNFLSFRAVGRAASCLLSPLPIRGKMLRESSEVVALLTPKVGKFWDKDELSLCISVCACVFEERFA